MMVILPVLTILFIYYDEVDLLMLGQLGTINMK